MNDPVYASPHPATIRLLRWSLGICYVWFGALKLFPHLSPAEDLAFETIHRLTFGLLEKSFSMYLLAAWEVGLGALFLVGWRFRLALKILLAHMVCTLTPAFLLPEVFFREAPFVLTLVGQYIVKNLVFMAVALVLLRAMADGDAGRRQEMPTSPR